MEDPRTPRQRYLARHQALKTARSSWDIHWRELAEYVRPRSPRFFAQSDRFAAGQKKHQRIINGTAGRALRILSSGLMAGVTSPARPWFRLTTPDPDLAESGAVKSWLSQVSQRMLWALGRSNIYNRLAELYPDLGLYGTGVLIVEEDPDTILCAYVVPVGEYALATDAKGRVATLYRETVLTVEQLVEKFGLAKCSQRVRDLYNRKQYDDTVPVLHVLEPRKGRDPKQLGPKGMGFSSCWLERDADADSGLLLESGYEEQPVMAPRWEVTGEDVYGGSPGMDALGDVKALQLYERLKATGVEKIVDPPTMAPAFLANKGFSLAPGAVTYVDAVGNQRVEAVVTVNPAFLGATTQAIQEHERRIDAAFFADLWLMLSEGADGGQKTAREIAERHEEKMLQLGPAMERLEAELLGPLVNRVFGILDRMGLLPPPPQELQGQDLKIEFLSIMTQAQKMIAGQAIEQQVGFVLQFAEVKPDVLDKANFDAMMDGHADALGLDAKFTRSDDQVAAIRDARNQAAQQRAQMEQAQAAAAGAKTLSETDMGGDSALSRLVGPMAAAQAGGVQ